jgi:hypothetical protein
MTKDGQPQQSADTVSGLNFSIMNYVKRTPIARKAVAISFTHSLHGNKKRAAEISR